MQNLVRLTLVAMATTFALGAESDRLSACYEYLLVQVFEVNTSDQRDGKHLLAQLQEATQSHQLPRTALAPSTESQPNTAAAKTGNELLISSN